MAHMDVGWCNIGWCGDGLVLCDVARWRSCGDVESVLKVEEESEDAGDLVAGLIQRMREAGVRKGKNE